MIPFSVLDLSPINQGATAGDALRNTLRLAQQAEQYGYQRFWLAEHHNMKGIASAATSIVIAHVAGGTKTIRVGSGGIMLPNHAPLVIAEQFGTLESLFPGRIDLGLGRAPGTDRATMRALRRDMAASTDQFPQDVQELQAYFEPAEPGQVIRAVPGAGLRVPLWLLGSSLFSAQLAAMLGLPFAFASHFAPDQMMQALQIYRSRFEPSQQLQKPHAMLTINVLAADTDEEARHQFTSQQQAFVNHQRGTPGQVPPPIDDFSSYCSPAERAGVDHTLGQSIVGSAATLENRLREFLARTQPDELMVTAHIYDQQTRLHSLKLIAEIRDRINASTSPAQALSDL